MTNLEVFTKYMRENNRAIQKQMAKAFRQLRKQSRGLA